MMLMRQGSLSSGFTKIKTIHSPITERKKVIIDLTKKSCFAHLLKSVFVCFSKTGCSLHVGLRRNWNKLRQNISSLGPIGESREQINRPRPPNLGKRRTLVLGNESISHQDAAALPRQLRELTAIKLTVNLQRGGGPGVCVCVSRLLMLGC